MNKSRESIEVGCARQLFLDDHFFAAAKGVNLVVNPPVDGGTAIRADRPWEAAGACGWCVVVPDTKQGDIKMYYEATGEVPDSAGGKPFVHRAMACAVSSDGVHWEKPDLDIHEFDGNKNNNIVLRGERGVEGRSYDQMGSVVIDESDVPERRYKALFCGSNCKMRAAYSPDGYHWTVVNEWKPVSEQAADSGNIVLWDPYIEKWVGYFRHWSATRLVTRVETDDFESWPRRTADHIVLAPDEIDAYDTLLDGPFIIAGEAIDSMEGFTDTGTPYKGKRFNPNDPREEFVWFTDDAEVLDGVDFYNQPVTIYPYADRAYVMPFSPFYHKPNLIEIQLAVSRDGITWDRPGDRQPWIRLPLDEEAIRIMYCGPGVVRDGDRLYHYHSYSKHWHGSGIPGTYERHRLPPYSGSIRRAVLRLDGYMSADAGNQDGRFVTGPIVHSGRRLELNVDTAASGWVQVELLDDVATPARGRRIHGFTLEDCDRITCNSTHRVVTWNGNDDVSALAGKAIRMHVRMRNAKLYAFQFAE